MTEDISESDFQTIELQSQKHLSSQVFRHTTFRGLLGAPRGDPSAMGVIIKYGSDNMIRTQVSLDEREYALAIKEASALGISVAEYVRRAIRETLPATGKGPWMRYAGFVESGNRRSSQSIDEIVYGAKD